MQESKQNKLRLWHIANVPNEPFQMETSSVEEAKSILNAIAMFDLEVGDGEEKPIASLAKRTKLTTDIPHKFPNHMKVVKSALLKYEDYLADQNNGVTICFSNAQGLEELVDGEWEEWHDEETDYDISELMRQQ